MPISGLQFLALLSRGGLELPPGLSAKLSRDRHRLPIDVDTAACLGVGAHDILIVATARSFGPEEIVVRRRDHALNGVKLGQRPSNDFIFRERNAPAVV